MQRKYVRPLSLEGSVNQNKDKDITKRALKEREVLLEQLTERLMQVFLDPAVGLVFRFLFQVARDHFANPQQQSNVFLRLVLSTAYARAEKAARRDRRR
jgi:hypothetical protein